MKLIDVIDALVKAFFILLWWTVWSILFVYVKSGLDACRAREYYSIVHKEDR